jgi:enediyne biosynthesis protein E3
MQAPLRTLFKFAFGLSPSEATFERRGFRSGDGAAREHLERVGVNFLEGYNRALEDRGCDALAAALGEVEAEFRGFAYEGAALALALLDRLIPWKRTRLRSVMKGPGAPHIYMMYVGAGWSLARLRQRLGAEVAEPNPLLRWLMLDGYGFHEGYFRWPMYVGERRPPKRLKGYARRAFDQGLGRSLWFVEGADVRRIASTIDGFPAGRRADLWSGVGLACAYAGGVGAAAVSELRQAAGDYIGEVSQGAAFAAKTRQRADNPAEHTETACRILCGLSADEAARVTDVELTGLAAEGSKPAYEVWRERIRARLGREVVPV